MTKKNLEDDALIDFLMSPRNLNETLIASGFTGYNSGISRIKRVGDAEGLILHSHQAMIDGMAARLYCFDESALRDAQKGGPYDVLGLLKALEKPLTKGEIEKSFNASRHLCNKLISEAQELEEIFSARAGYTDVYGRNKKAVTDRVEQIEIERGARGALALRYIRLPRTIPEIQKKTDFSSAGGAVTAIKRQAKKNGTPLYKARIDLGDKVATAYCTRESLLKNGTRGPLAPKRFVEEVSL